MLDNNSSLLSAEDHHEEMIQEEQRCVLKEVQEHNTLFTEEVPECSAHCLSAEGIGPDSNYQ